MKIKYIAHYDLIHNANRCVSPAAINKLNYILDVLSSNFNIEIISAAQAKNGLKLKSDYYQINESTKLRLLKSKLSNNRIIRKIQSAYFRFKLFVVCLFSIKKDDIVIVYHSLELMKIIKYLRIFKKNKIILQIEEIYSHVINKSDKKELSFFKNFSSFIISNSDLKKFINGKKYVVINGIYKMNNKNFKYNDKIIHIVYSGILEKSKGVLKIFDIAKYLDENYQIHILGFGSQTDVDTIKNKIAQNISNCKVTYEGLLLGEEYNDFLSKCDIGLALQDISAKYNSTSFPSKIMTYLTNNLKVVSTKIESVLNSEISSLIRFSEDDGFELAKTIRKVKSDENNINQFINQLNNKFETELINIIKGAENV